MNLAMAFIVIATAVFYVCYTMPRTLWQWQIAPLAGAAAASFVALLWGGFYACYTCSVTEQGITVGVPFLRRHYTWSELRHAELEESDSQGIASCHIILHFESGKLRVSSDLFDLEAVQTLRDDMVSVGVLSKVR